MSCIPRLPEMPRCPSTAPWTPLRAVLVVPSSLTPPWDFCSTHGQHEVLCPPHPPVLLERGREQQDGTSPEGLWVRRMGVASGVPPFMSTGWGGPSRREGAALASAMGHRAPGKGHSGGAEHGARARAGVSHATGCACPETRPSCTVAWGHDLAPGTDGPARAGSTSREAAGAGAGSSLSKNPAQRDRPLCKPVGSHSAAPEPASSCHRPPVCRVR